MKYIITGHIEFELDIPTVSKNSTRFGITAEVDAAATEFVKTMFRDFTTFKNIYLESITEVKE